MSAEDENEIEGEVSENNEKQNKNYFPHLRNIPLDIRLKDPSGNEIPDEFDPRRLTLLSRHQVVFWDETHPKISISTGNIKNFQDLNVEVKFPRDKEGNFCINSNKYTTSTEKIVKVKYQDEVRLCLGVASVKMPNGSIIGKRADIIDYTGKVIISEDEENRRIQMEIDRVRKIRNNSSNKK